MKSEQSPTGKIDPSESSTAIEKYEIQLSPLKKNINRQSKMLRRFIGRTALAFSLRAQRLMDMLLAILFIALLSPIFIFLLFITLPRARNASGPRYFYGKYGTPFRMLYLPVTDEILPKAGDATPDRKFIKRYSLHKLPVLINILKGDLSFVGPSPVPYPSREIPEYVRQTTRPGLTNPYLLRKAVNIAHEAEMTADREYIHQRSAKGDLGVLLRSALILPTSGEKPIPTPEINMLDITIRNMKMSEVINKIAHDALQTTPVQLAFVNPDCMNIACTNNEYKALLQKLDFVLADGIGIHIACKLMNTSMDDNVNGTDLFPYLCERAMQDHLPIYFLGGKPGIVDAMVEVLHAKYPALVIAGFQHGYFKPEEEGNIINTIKQSGARILLVALGAPRQELWIHSNLNALGVGIALGVGGLFDFMSGQTKRAPRWMREIGVEWVYRLLQEPGRMWRRYIIGNPLFLWRVMRWQKRMKAGNHQ